MEAKIKKIEFTDQLILTTTTDGYIYCRPLDAFPLLQKATPSQREDYVIGKWGDDVRLESIDEDIYISSLTQQLYQPNPLG